MKEFSKFKNSIIDYIDMCNLDTYNQINYTTAHKGVEYKDNYLNKRQSV